MFMKIKITLSALTLFIVLFIGCTANQPKPSPSPTPTASPGNPSETEPDVITTASIVADEASFEKAISNNGTWIICATKNLTFDKELVLEGEYKNGKKDANGQDVIQRKIALYSQDENRNITARYTLTAPKLTINSPEASIQHGTFKGDLYVAASNFQLVDTVVEGNIYFITEEAKSTFKMDDKSKVTGVQELKVE